MPSQIDTVRQFNRFYTRQIGVLDSGHLGSRCSITEVRVLYELAHRASPTAAEVGDHLGLDAGYLSRVLRRFERMKLITRRASISDRRRAHLRLTRAGRAAFAALDRKASAEVARMLKRVKPAVRHDLIAGMTRIRRTLDASGATPGGGIRLRRHKPGDMGWI